MGTSPARKSLKPKQRASTNATRAAATPAGRFEGFGDAGASFFRALSINNERDWFQAHKADYEAGWRLPMEALLEEVRARLEKTYPGLLGKPKVFRINRDVRFSKDKSPYKTNIGGFLPLSGHDDGRSQVEVPAALYFHVSHTELFAATGLYGMTPESLARHREALLDERRGRELDRILAALEREDVKLEAREALKRPPPGIDPQHPRIELLKMKGLIAVSPELERRLLVGRALVEPLVAFAKTCAPLNRWLVKNAL